MKTRKCTKTSSWSVASNLIIVFKYLNYRKVEIVCLGTPKLGYFKITEMRTGCYFSSLEKAPKPSI
jgi:hypothetical protein